MNKFIKGTRVRLIHETEDGHTKVGQVGTIIEESENAPWIQFDEPTGYDVGVWMENGTIGRAGYCDCIMIPYLEIIPC